MSDPGPENTPAPPPPPPDSSVAELQAQVAALGAKLAQIAGEAEPYVPPVKPDVNHAELAKGDLVATPGTGAGPEIQQAVTPAGQIHTVTLDASTGLATKVAAPVDQVPAEANLPV